MPKNNKLPLLTQKNSDDFFEKLKTRDEYVYKEFIKLIILTYIKKWQVLAQ